MRAIDALELKRSISVSAVIEDGKHIFDIIDEQPTIEPDRKRGCWVVIDDEPCDVYKCDQCGTTYDTIDNTWDLPYFCPNCGADMRGEQDE